MKVMAVFFLFATARLLAQPNAELYAVTFYSPKLIRIDTNSGAGTLVADLSASPLDVATQGGKLWVLATGVGVDRLLSIDAWTGTVLEQRSFATSLPGGEGAMDFAADGMALAVKVTSSTGTLFRIDMRRTNVLQITKEGGLAPSLDGLAFDTNGTLHGLSQNAGGFTLYMVDTNTGATTAIGPLGVQFPGTGGAVAGLAFAPDGSLFAAAGNPTESRLYRVNKLTGAAALIGSVGFGGVSGIRFFVPPPGPLEIARAQGAVKISWPHLRGGILEGVGSITGEWAAVAAPLTTNGDQVSTTQPVGERSSMFFRLRK